MALKAFPISYSCVLIPTATSRSAYGDRAGGRREGRLSVVRWAERTKEQEGPGGAAGAGGRGGVGAAGAGAGEKEKGKHPPLPFGSSSPAYQCGRRSLSQRLPLQMRWRQQKSARQQKTEGSRLLPREVTESLLHPPSECGRSSPSASASRFSVGRDSCTDDPSPLSTTFLLLQRPESGISDP